MSGNCGTTDTMIGDCPPLRNWQVFTRTNPIFLIVAPSGTGRRKSLSKGIHTSSIPYRPSRRRRSRKSPRMWRHVGPFELSALRSFLKNVLWPNLCVGIAFQLLKIRKYSSGLKHSPALTLDQNPIFAIASNVHHTPIEELRSLLRGSSILSIVTQTHCRLIIN